MHNQPAYDTNIVLALKKSIRQIDALIDAHLYKYQIPRTQYRVMFYVANNPDITQSALVKLMEIQASTLTLMIDSLVKKGIIERRKTEVDKRINYLCLTTKGLEKFQQLPNPSSLIDEFVRERLGDQSITDLISGLNALNQLLS